MIAPASGVYYAVVGDLLKIGQSRDVIHRLSGLSSSRSGAYVELIGYIPLTNRREMLDRERMETDWFSPWRVSGREWFVAHESVIRLIPTRPSFRRRKVLWPQPYLRQIDRQWAREDIEEINKRLMAEYLAPRPAPKGQ